MKAKLAIAFLIRAKKWFENHNKQNQSNEHFSNLGNDKFASSEPPKIFGSFEDIGYNPFVKQNANDTCAIKSQQMILERFGINISEEALVVEAEANGWYSPGEGTPSAYVGNLLESHGIPVNRFTNANIFTLQNELAQGHQVVVSVDASELWYNEDFSDYANHALIVSHMDTSDPKNPVVTLKDPGNGYVEQYPWATFEDAWQDGGYEIFSTKIAPPAEFAPGMEHFDYNAGHIADFDGFSYENFLSAHVDKFCQPIVDSSESNDWEVTDEDTNNLDNLSETPDDFETSNSPDVEGINAEDIDIDLN